LCRFFFQLYKVIYFTMNLTQPHKVYIYINRNWSVLRGFQREITKLSRARYYIVILRFVSLYYCYYYYWDCYHRDRFRWRSDETFGLVLSTNGLLGRIQLFGWPDDQQQFRHRGLPFCTHAHTGKYRHVPSTPSYSL